MMPDKDKGNWIGKSTRRVGGLERVTGRLRYAADLRLDHVLQVKLVQVDCARARIRSIDTTEAMKVDGVVCVMTAADLPQPMPRCGPGTNDRPVIAVDETKFFGEPVAAVAAETLDAAEAAAALVRVDYEELPAVLTVEAARDPRSPLVQDPSLRAGKPLAETNTFQENHFGWGDVENADAECVVANEYRFPMVTHFAIEPHAYLAAPDQNGITVWSPIQHPYVLQRVVAHALSWPISRVRVIAPDPGGGFGGKGYPKFEPLLAFLALETGRPVRLVLTLEETFQAVRRASARVRIRTGFDGSGRLQFQDIEADFLIGAYADVGPRVVSKAGFSACGPYRVPNARTIARALLSHTTPSTAFRGFGTPQLSWAVESQFDEAARQLGIDRVEIRRRNIPQKGETFIPGDTPADGVWVETLEKASAAIGWGKPLPKYRGRGISMGLKSSSTAAVSFAMVRLHHDGSASILSGTSDMGQGARTVFTQLVAQELAIPLERITVVMGDTSVVPYDMSTSASRSTVFMGNAILKACQEVKSQLQQLASELFSIAKEEITVEPGCVRAAGQTLTYAELLRKYYGPSRGEVLSIGSTRNQYLPNHPLLGKAAFWEVMCAAVEVEVDPETGMVQVTKLVLASDVGKALNPQQVEAQDEGSAIMGLGHTLMEHLILDEHGRILNLGALDYRIPTMKDIPLEFHSILIENADGPGPFGAKGTGEGGILSIAAAVGSAVAEATGVVIRELPLTPERVWRAIQDASGEVEFEPRAAESSRL
jgi:CO/xanthine dehydrogenase Mo-binding subunit